MSLLKDYKLLTPTERSLWREPMMWLAAAAIILTPLLYACIYLDSSLDPYGRLDNLPVGLVNLDTGTTAQGKVYALGQNVVENLRADGRFQYLEYDTETAAKTAVRRGDVYFSLTIPKDFSQKAVAGSSAQHGSLLFYVAEGSNYFASRVAGSFSAALSEDLNRTLGENRWEVVQRSLRDVQRGFADIRTATGRLRDGANVLADGAGRLNDGTRTLATGAQKAATGSAQLTTGADTLAGGVGQLTDGTKELSNGLRQLEAAAPGQAELEPLQTGAAQLSSGATALSGGLRQLSTGASDLASSATTLETGAQKLARGNGQLAGQLPELENGLGQLKAGADDLSKGATAVNTGAEKLAGGSQKLAAGLPELRTGLGQTR